MSSVGCEKIPYFVSEKRHFADTGWAERVRRARSELVWVSDGLEWRDRVKWR
jgi:hypothetical protein